MKKKKTNVIEFYDNETTYAMIETTESPKKIRKLLEKYKEIDEDYDIEGFLEWLEEQGVKFKVIPQEADYYIYF